MLGGFLSLVSLALDSWLLSINHLTKSVKEHDGRDPDMKRVSWGHAGIHRAYYAQGLYPMTPIQSDVSYHTSVCFTVCRIDSLP